MISWLKSLGYIEYGLILSIFWSVLWLFNEYLASLLTVILVPIFFFILLIALVSELIERSKVPRSFFIYVGMAWVIPLLIGIFVFISFEGIFDWLQEM